MISLKNSKQKPLPKAMVCATKCFPILCSLIATKL